MQRRLWLSSLCLQIVLAVAAPPISLGERSIFPSDLWFFVWVFLASGWLFRILPAGVKRPFLFQLLLPAVLFLGIYAHGAMRTSMMPAMLIYNKTPPDDHFQAGRELVICLRFVSWLWGGLVINEWYKRYRDQLSADIRILQRTLAIVTTVAVTSLLAAKLFPSVAHALGRLYGYNPDAEVWWDRTYGIFRSPVEGSMTLGLSLLFLLAPTWSLPIIQWGCALLVVIGVLLTKTISTFAAVMISIALCAFFRMQKELRRALFAGAATFFSIALWASSSTLFFTQKKNNLVYRMIPWKVIWNGTVQRWDTALFGTGFNPHYVDDIYLFLMNRGGVLLLLGVILAIGRPALRNWRELGWQQRSIILTILITGVTLDNLIIRPFAMLLVVVGVPLLCLRSSESRVSVLS